MDRPRALPLLLSPAAGCNCDVCPYYVNNPSAAEPICSGRSDSCNYCACSIRTATVSPDARNGCGACPVRCGSRPDISGWMDDLGGTLAFDDIHLAGATANKLPWATPLMNSSVSLIRAAEQHRTWPAWGVSLARVLSRSHHFTDTNGVRPQWTAGAHKTMGLDPGRQHAVLAGYGNDRLLERFWTYRRGIIPQLAEQGWSLVTTPDFSMWLNAPRAEQMVSMRRSLMIAEEMEDAGLPVAPVLYWYRLEDLDRWVSWIIDTDPPAIVLPAHTLRGDRTWDALAAPGFSLIADALDRNGLDATVLLTGLSSTRRIAAAASCFGPRMRLLTQQPWMCAMKGKQLDELGAQVPHDAHRNDLLAHNIATLNRTVETCVSAAQTIRDTTAVTA